MASHQQNQNGGLEEIKENGPAGIARTSSGVPATLSPSSWARASVPLYPALPTYSGGFADSSRFLVPAAAGFAGGQPQGKYSEPLSLRGTQTFLRLAAVLHIGLWLVRDSSLTSFMLYSVFVTGALYFLIVKGEPFSLALHVESASSVAARQQNGSNNNNAAAGAQPAGTPTFAQRSLNGSPVSSGSSSSPVQPYGQQQQQSVSSNSKSSPAPVAFAFVKQASLKQAPGDLDTTSPTPTQPPVFHESDSSKKNSSLGTSLLSLPTPSSAINPTIDPINMPQTPSVEPVITPMPQRPEGSDRSVTSVVAPVLHMPTESTPVVVAGATARHSSHDLEQSWTRASGSSYDVRIGPNYKKYGKKAPSKGALFECVGVDVFGAPDGKLEHVAQYLQLPWIAKPSQPHQDAWRETAANPQKPAEDPSPPSELDPVLKASDHYEVDPAVLAIDEELGVPTLFIVNFQIPTYAPSIFGSKEDGEGFSILLYFQITEATRAEIKSGKLSGAVQLFKEFVNNADMFEYHSRFKAIPRIVNPSEAKVGMATRQAMKMYNSKPFLTGPHCHSFIRGPGYMEADIDVHRFCLSARKGANGTLDALQSLIVDIGFVIEAGRDNADQELPEMILACGRIAHLDPLHAPSLKYFIDIGRKERAKRMGQ